MGTCCSKPYIDKSSNAAYKLSGVATYSKYKGSRETWSFDGDPGDPIQSENGHANGGFGGKENNSDEIQTIHQENGCPKKLGNEHANGGFNGKEKKSEEIQTINHVTGSGDYTNLHTHDEDQRRTVIRNFVFLRENMISDEVCDILYSKECIGEEKRQYIMSSSEIEMIRRADLLLQTLLQEPTFGKIEYDMIVGALEETGQNRIVEHLNAQLDSITENSKSDYAEQICYYSEEEINIIADHLDIHKVAPLCLEREYISIHDYVNIFKFSHERKEYAKQLLDCVVKKKLVLQKFKDLLKETNHLRVLELLSEFKSRQQSPNVLNIQVDYQPTSLQIPCLHSKEQVILTDTKGHKITISIDGDFEVSIITTLTKTTTSLYTFTERTNSDVLKVESGSIVIYLKSYDNLLMKQLDNPDKDHSLLCSLIKSIIEQYDFAQFVKGEHKMRVKLTIHEDDVDINILGETGSVENVQPNTLSAVDMINQHTKFICGQLNPHKYRKYILEKKICDFSYPTHMSRVEKMEMMLKIVLPDTILCEQLLQLIRENEPGGFYETIAWNGTPNHITGGIRCNFKYLTDELVPGKIIPLILNNETDGDLLTTQNQDLFKISQVKDRRVCSIMLLRLVLNGSDSLIKEFYDVLIASHPFELPKRIRQSSNECKGSKSELPFSTTTSLQTEDGAIPNTESTESSLLFEGDFAVNITFDPGFDNLQKKLPIRDECGDEQDHCDQFYESDIYNGLKTGDSKNWESHVFAIRIRPNLPKKFYFNPLKNGEDAILEICISDIRNDSTSSFNRIIVPKVQFNNRHSLSIEKTVYNTCLIKSTFGDSYCNTKTTNSVLYIKSSNVWFSERDNNVQNENQRRRDGTEQYSKTLCPSNVVVTKAQSFAGKPTYSELTTFKVNDVEFVHDDMSPDVKRSNENLPFSFPSFKSNTASSSGYNSSFKSNTTHAFSVQRHSNEFTDMPLDNNITDHTAF